MLISKQKAEALHYYFEIKKVRIKAEQRLKLAKSKEERKLQRKSLKQFNGALKALGKYL